MNESDVEPLEQAGFFQQAESFRSQSLPEQSSPGHEVGLIEILAQLVRRRWLTGKITASAMLAGTALAFLLPVRYTALTRLMPPQQAQSSAAILMNQLAGNGAGSLAGIAGGGLGLKNPNDIYVGLLTSRPVADALIGSFGLEQVYGVRDRTGARKKLAESTAVATDKNGFIAVAVTDRDRHRAAEMANAYTAQLRALTRSLAVTEAAARRIFYEERLKEAKEALVTAEVDFEQVQQKKGLVQLDAQSKAMIEGLAALRAQIAAKQVEVEALRSYSTEHNPEVELAERELQSLQAQATHTEQRGHPAAFAEFGLADVPGAGRDYLRAEHELKYRQAMYDMLMKQLDAARLDEAKEAAIIQVVEAAIDPDRRSSPQRALIVVLATCAGLLSGCIVALILWWKELACLNPQAGRRIKDFQYAIRERTCGGS
jgi:capsule polysaccharide export protein KpsE/RkpR